MQKDVRQSMVEERPFQGDIDMDFFSIGMDGLAINLQVAR